VPLDFAANPATLERLMRHLRVSSHIELLRTLHVDIVDLRGVVDPRYVGPIPQATVDQDGVQTNYWGMKTRVMDTAMGPEESYCDFIFKDVADVGEMESHPWPTVDWFDFSDLADRLKGWGEYAVMASGPSVFQHPTFLRGLENLLTDMLTAPAIADYLMDRFTDFYVAYFDRMFESAPGMIDLLRIADDLGTQQGLLIGPHTFERFFAPRIRKLVDMAHSHGVKVMFHSCGSIVPLIERLISLGVDILDPIQVAAKGMDPQAIKSHFGDRLCLHGAIDTQYLLPRGTPQQVRETARHMIDVLGTGGGYILAPCHVLQTDVPMDNITTMYDTAYKHGSYLS
jgi:uroporphyrinogen decarboxylase